MNLQHPVKDIMTANVHAVNEKDDLKKALRTIKKFKIRHLPVLKGKDVAGIISSTDLNRLTFGGLFSNSDIEDEAVLDMLTISQVMTNKVRSVQTDSTVEDVARIFSEEGFHALPVLEGTELRGIVTTTDIIKFMLGSAGK
jgi:CBS domain-containing protein